MPANFCFFSRFQDRALEEIAKPIIRMLILLVNIRRATRLFPKIDSSGVIPTLSPIVHKAEAVSKKRGKRGFFSIR